jgi:ribosome-binding protein aMBF1 (putative translation factor)
MLNWILSQFKRQSAEDLERARELVKAAERGGAHVNLSKARELARALGVEVEVHASADEVVHAIRRYLSHHGEL